MTKIILNQLLSVVLLYSLTACGQQETKTTTDSSVAQDVNIAEFEAKVAEGHVIILDVRTAGEVSEGHIPNAINVDYYATDFKMKVDHLDRDRTILLYCAAGSRSSKAMKLMSDMGFKALYNLKGGYSAWKSAGKEIAR